MKTFLLRTSCMGIIAFALSPLSTWASSGDNNPGVSTKNTQESSARQKQLTLKAQEQKAAVEEVNALIVDSYKTLLDKVLDQLYTNIAQASSGDKGVQIRALSKVRDDLDKQLDKLEDGSITPNRKKILQGVYFYLKSNVEQKIKGLQE